MIGAQIKATGTQLERERDKSTEITKLMAFGE